MTYLIVGRTGTGKDTLAAKLSEHGLKCVKSYTTRPRRSQDEDTHIFISKEEADKITDRVAYTAINGYEYFATSDQVKNADIYIIDPNGLYELTANMPDETFYVIHMTADAMRRKINAVHRADDKIKEEMIFDKRDASENDQFTEFENKINADDGSLPRNITCVIPFENDYDINSINNLAKELSLGKTLHDRMTALVNEGISLNIMDRDETDPSKVKVMDENGKMCGATAEYFADMTLASKDSMFAFITALIAKSDKFAI